MLALACLSLASEGVVLFTVSNRLDEFGAIPNLFLKDVSVSLIYVSSSLLLVVTAAW